MTFNNGTDYIIKGKYKLMNYLKGGGFGDIFFARHVEKNYEVAIKFVSIHDLFMQIILCTLNKS